MSGKGTSPTLQLGFFPGNVIPLSSSPSKNGEELEDEPMDCPYAQTDLPDFCPSLLLCCRLLSCFSWDRNYDLIFNGSMVLSFDLLLPPLDLHLRVSRHRLAPDDCLWLLCHRRSSLLATRSFLSSPCTDFDPSDFCPSGVG